MCHRCDKSQKCNLSLMRVLQEWCEYNVSVIWVSHESNVSTTWLLWGDCGIYVTWMWCEYYINVNISDMRVTWVWCYYDVSVTWLWRECEMSVTWMWQQYYSMIVRWMRCDCDVNASRVWHEWILLSFISQRNPIQLCQLSSPYISGAEWLQ